VRLLRLRLVAAALVGLWVSATVVLLAAYRPGGPFDPAVSVAGIAGVAASAAAFVWPPLAHGKRAGIVVGWLGLASILVLVPSLINLLASLGTGDATLFLPSPEAAYGWLLALVGTCVYAGLGVSRRLLGAASPRGQRIALAAVVALAVVGVAGGISAVAALSTELALRDSAATTSDWGPTDPGLVPPVCIDGASAGPGARVTLGAEALVDGQVVGEAGLEGTRSGTDEAWSGWVKPARALLPGAAPGSSSTSHEPASVTGTAIAGGGSAPGSALPGVEYVRAGGAAWVRVPGSAWRPTDRGDAAGPSLDEAIVAVALSDRARLAAEDLGIELIGGARARHCRLLVDGSVALAAFRPLRWLIGQAALSAEPDLADWRGELDWWVFADRQLGMAKVTVSGIVPQAWSTSGPQGMLRATLTARARDASHLVAAPTP
jgi:hypothetical protein